MALADQSDFADETPRRGGLARFFGVLIDPKTYGALLYMFLALATGIFYFTWVVTGLSLSVSMMILIIGLPLALLFVASVRVISYAEGYLAQGLLGANLTRLEEETLSPGDEEGSAAQNLWTKIKAMLKDGRTWTSMVYMVLQLGLGIIYFTFAVTALSVSISFIAAPILEILYPGEVVVFDAHEIELLNANVAWLGSLVESPYASWVLLPIGAFMLLLSLHVVRGVGALHRKIAEALLVRHG